MAEPLQKTYLSDYTGLKEDVFLTLINFENLSKGRHSRSGIAASHKCSFPLYVDRFTSGRLVGGLTPTNHANRISPLACSLGFSLCPPGAFHQ